MLKCQCRENGLNVIFDGTTHCAEALAILVCYIDDSWKIQQQLLCIRLLTKSLAGEEVAHELIQVLSVNYSIPSNYLIAAMRDRVSVNSVVMKTVKIVYPKYLMLVALAIQLIELGNISTFLPLQSLLQIGCHFFPQC